jgi:hypothetical protein
MALRIPPPKPILAQPLKPFLNPMAGPETGSQAGRRINQAPERLNGSQAMV